MAGHPSPITAETTSKPWYKCIKNGHAINGGTYVYSLPAFKNGAWIPGKWSPDVDNVRCCYRGYHVTRRVQNWAKPGGQYFVAEVRGLFSNDGSTYTDASVVTDDKIAVTAVRLVRPITIAEFKAFFSTTPLNFVTGMTKLWKEDSDAATKVFIRKFERLEAARIAREKRKQVAFELRLKREGERAEKRYRRRSARLKGVARHREVNLMKRLAKKLGFVVRLAKSR